MNRHDETGKFGAVDDGDAPPAPGEPVGRVNLPDEPDPDPQTGIGAPGESGSGVALNPAREQMREKMLFGVLAVGMMILAMIVILQGVFEQKMPV